MKTDIKINTVSEWEKLGILSFARYYDLTMDEAITMINSPNNTFYEMMVEMEQAMMRYENFMVKIRKAEEEELEWTRLDFLDFER